LNTIHSRLIRSGSIASGVISLMLFGTPSAIAATVTATLTADNKYALFYGQADGSGLTFVGRNEIGSGGNPGLYDWSLPETFSFDVNPGDRLYVAAWDGCAGLHCVESFIGQFQLPNGVYLLSNTVGWEYSLINGVMPDSGIFLSPTELITSIKSATWTTPNVVGFNGTLPWDKIPGISPFAQFLDWTPGSNTAIFRTKVAVVPKIEPEPVPEPASVLGLLAFGAFGAVSLRKRKQQ
jgi:PEP-CTERM motif